MISIMHVLDYSRICEENAKKLVFARPQPKEEKPCLPECVIIVPRYTHHIYILVYNDLATPAGLVVYAWLRRASKCSTAIPKTIKNRDPDHIQRWDFQVLLLQFDLVSSHHSMSAETKVMMWASTTRAPINTSYPIMQCKWPLGLY